MISHLLLSVNKASVACLHPDNQVQGAHQGFGAQHALPGMLLKHAHMARDPLQPRLLLTGVGTAAPWCAASCSMPLITSELGRRERPEETAQAHRSMLLHTD